jgi:hypothetical protein
MKNFLYILLFSIIFFSCKKQSQEPGSANTIPADYLARVKSYLQNNLSPGDYSNLDFGSGSISRQTGNWYLRLGFSDKKPKKDFLLLQTDSLGDSSQARIIHLEKEELANNPAVFNGSISIQTLQHELVLSLPVSNGWIEALHPVIFSKPILKSEAASSVGTDIIPAPWQELPEVVVVGYIPSGAGISYSDWMSFASILNGAGGSTGAGSGAGSGSGSGPGSGGGVYTAVYSPIGGSSGTSGGNSASSQNNNLIIYYEASPSKPAIDVQAWMKCFAGIPDVGSQCSVSIFADLPVNDDPNLFFNWYSGNTGHAFLQLTKTNAGQSISQLIGFTAVKPLAALVSNGAVAGKIVDNGGHKYNASLTMHVNPQQFGTELKEIEYLSGTISYSIENYNCVDFALQAINAIRGGSPLSIPKYPIPGQLGISNTPEGLYKLLTGMKAAGGVEAGNILSGVVLNAGSSHGPCN